MVHRVYEARAVGGQLSRQLLDCFQKFDEQGVFVQLLLVLHQIVPCSRYCVFKQGRTQWCQLKGCAALSGLPIFVVLTQASASLLPGLSMSAFQALATFLAHKMFAEA